MRKIILSESQFEKIMNDTDNGTLTPYTPEEGERNRSVWQKDKMQQTLAQDYDEQHNLSIYKNLAVGAREVGLNMLAYLEADPKQANRIVINQRIKELEEIIDAAKQQLGYKVKI